MCTVLQNLTVIERNSFTKYRDIFNGTRKNCSPSFFSLMIEKTNVENVKE
jgi:hypothetical protein